MICPICKINLKEAILCNAGVDCCPKCLGLWFEEEELRLAKDEKDRNLRWLDIDLWREDGKFRIFRGQKLCPSCRLPLYETEYAAHPEMGEPRPENSGRGDADIKVDLCNICRGIWLDRGEFKKIIEYLKKKENYEVLNRYTQNLIEEFWEIFSGPETLREELSDFVAILKVLNYKFAIQHPKITGIIASLPR